MDGRDGRRVARRRSKVWLLASLVLEGPWGAGACSRTGILVRIFLIVFVEAGIVLWDLSVRR
jgi:hypothetical protein